MAVVSHSGFEVGGMVDQRHAIPDDFVSDTPKSAIFKQLMAAAKEKGTSVFPFLPIRIYFDGRKDQAPQKVFLVINTKVVAVGINWLWNNLNDEGIAELAILRLRRKYFVGKVHTTIYPRIVLVEDIDA